MLDGHRFPRGLALSALPCLLALCASAQAQSVPAKIDVEAEALASGRGHRVTVRLLDRANQPAKALERMEVYLSVRTSPTDAKPVGRTVFEPGESSKTTDLPVLGMRGLVYLWARHPALLAGGVHLKVARAGGGTVQAAPPPPAQARETAYPLALRVSPERDFWADGQDEARLSAFYLGPGSGPPEDLTLRFSDGTGSMDPSPLSIPRGRDVGESRLRFNQVGKVAVEFIRASAPVELDGDRRIELNFVTPPGTRLKLTASPPAITLAETSQLVVQILTQAGTPVAPGSQQPVVFSIRDGRGSLSHLEATFEPGRVSAQTEFRPTAPGDVTVAASMAGVPEATVNLAVSLPGLLLAVSGLAGLLGGLIAGLPKKLTGAWWKHRGLWTRGMVGLVTGFLLYWAAGLGLAGILDRTLLLNPLSAFVVAAVGGWMGTEVFAVLAKRFGGGDAGKPRSAAAGA
jgi:hypothetical protein